MRKLILLSLVLIFALLSSVSESLAQKSANRYFYGKYIQLPSEPLSIDKYDFIVYQNGETPEMYDDIDQDYESMKEAYEIDLKSYFVQIFNYDKQMVEIGTSEEMSMMKKQLQMVFMSSEMPTKPKSADLVFEDKLKFYAMEMKIHSARIDSLNNAGLKMLVKSQLTTTMNETAPVRPIYIRKSAGPYKLSNVIISKRMTIRGLKRVYNDPSSVFFEITMDEFETEEEILKDSDNTMLILNYRRVVGYKIIDENNEIIDEGLVPKSDEWIKEAFNLGTTKKSDINKKRKSFEKLSTETNIDYTKSFLASRYGHPIVSRSFRLSFAKGKKFNYEKIAEAYEMAVNVLQTSLCEDKPDLSNLNKAIEIWELELKDADFSNKKARINASVSTGLYFNIIECSIWLNEFDKSVKLLDELSKLKIKSKTVRRIDLFRGFIKKREKRYNANNKTLAKS